jgi:hypothetical protein
MSTKAHLLAAHKAMSAVLDAKLAKLQEWQAFRSIDRALLNLIEEAATPNLPALPVAPVVPAGAEKHRDARSYRARKNSRNGEPSYPDLGVRALTESGHPMPTVSLIDFIRQHRKLPKTDARRVQVNISSSFSHDERMENINWNGERAWWLVGRQPPPAPSPNGHAKIGEFDLPIASRT